MSLCKEDQNICLFFFLSDYFHIIHQKKHQPRKTTSSLCKEDQNICFFFFSFFLSNYFLIIHQKTPTKNNNNNFFMKRRSKHLLLLLLLPRPRPPLTLSSHPSQKITNKSSNSNFGFQKIQNLSFSSFSLQLSSHPSQLNTNNGNGNGNFFMHQN